VIGTPEHTALLSGSLDLGEIMNENREPLVGFAPIVLDPAGPRPEDLTDRTARRGRRGGGLPVPRSVRRRSSSSPAGAAGTASNPDDPTATGELARPFVTESSLAKWVTSDDPPPPVSVDVFQRAVRAGLAPEQAAGLLTEAKPTGGTRSSRTRRELRSRERAAGSIRGVTARRLAKGGILAFTALGVVATTHPQVIENLGLDRDKVSAPDGLGFATALAPKAEIPALTPQGELARRLVQRERLLRAELQEQHKDTAFTATSDAGSAIADLAFQQDAAVDAHRKAELARVTREVARNPRAYAAQLIEERGWDSAQFQCLNQLWNRESQWNYRAVNRSSGAYGIAQALPGSKMSSFGSDWRTNPITQMKWGMNYIDDRYGTPCAAWDHSQKTGWY
jgi:hypothetical protein